MPEPAVETQESPSIDEVVATHEPPPVSEDPITPESVQSDKAPVESLPDSSLIADRLQKEREAYTQSQQAQAQEQDVETMKEELRMLRLLRGGELSTSQPATEAVSSDDAGKAHIQRIEALENRIEGMNAELSRRQAENDHMQAQTEVVSWVKEQADHFPLLNAIGQQALVYQKMINVRDNTGQYLSEGQAGREVEAELRTIVERCAPQMGYTKSQVEQRREEQVSVGAGNLNIVDPINTDDLSDDEALNALVAQYDNNQR